MLATRRDVRDILCFKDDVGDWPSRDLEKVVSAKFTHALKLFTVCGDPIIFATVGALDKHREP